MRHRNKTIILGIEKGPREALLRNLATSVILYEKLTTTEAKAKAVRPLVERMITKGKVNTVNSRRALMKVLYDEKAVLKILEVLGPRFKERKGGYTRIIKVGLRVGDGGKTAVIELV